MAALCWLCLVFLLGGCWNRTEIEDTAYIVAIAIDAAGSDYLWTFRIMQAENLPLGMLSTTPGPSKGMAAGVVSARAPSLDSAVQMVQTGFTRIISLEQLRFVVFGESTARQGLAPVIEQLVNHYQVRRGAGIILALGTAHAVFTAFQPVGDLNPIKVNEGILLVEKRLHLSPPMRLQHFYSRLLAPGVDPIMPLDAINPRAEEPPGSPLPSPAGRSLRAGQFPRNGGNPVEIAGTGIFRSDRLVGMLSVNETAMLLALRGEMGKQYGTVPDPREPGKIITIRFGQENKPKFRAAFVGGRPVIHVKLQLEGEIVATTGRTDYSRPENRRLLEEFIARDRWPKEYADLMRKVYGEWGADPVGFGNLLRSHFPTFDAWLKYDWMQHKRDLQVTVETELFIRRFGLTLGKPRISRGR